MPSFSGIESTPRYRYARHPQSPEGFQYPSKFLTAGEWQGRKHNLLGRAGRLLSRERAERLARPHFQQDASAISTDFCEAIRETDRVPDVIGPVLWRPGLDGGHPASRDVRHIWNLWLLQIHGAN